MEMEEKRPPIPGIKTAPRGNQAIDKADVERGLEKLERVVGN
jgi:hypothetical protein